MTTTPTDKIGAELDLFARCVWESEDVIELRGIGGPEDQVRQRWTKAQGIVALADRMRIANEKGLNLHAGINPRTHDGGSTAQDVALARCLFVDADNISPEELIRKIDEATLPTPTVLIDSGHGAHAYWRLAEPIEELDLWSRLQRALIGLLGTDRVLHDPPRVMRLPGLMNVKGEPVPCKIIRADLHARYGLDEFPEPAAEPEQTAAPTVNGEIAKGHRDATLTSLAGTMRRRGITQEGIEAALIAENNNRCDPPLSEAQVKKIAKSVSRYQPADHSGAPEQEPNRLVSRTLADVEPEAIGWLWYHRLPRRKLSLLAGIQGLGKSFVTIDAAARISTGSDWPDGAKNERGSIILLNLEDGLADTIRPRLDAAGADVTRIHAVEAVEAVDRSGQRSFNIVQDAHLLAEKIREIGDVRLVIIDPLSAYLTAKVDAHRDNEVRGVLNPLGQLAEQHNVAVIGVMHLAKAAQERAIFKIHGSIGFTAFARAVWLVAQDRDNPDDRLLLPVKMNVAKPAPGLRFRIDEPGVVTWLEGEVDMTADEALAPARDEPDEAGPKVQSAAEWLTQLLEKRGAQKAKDIRKAARENCIAPRTLDRAKDYLGVQSTLATGIGSDWYWHLPGVTFNGDGEPES